VYDKRYHNLEGENMNLPINHRSKDDSGGNDNSTTATSTSNSTTTAIATTTPSAVAITASATTNTTTTGIAIPSPVEVAFIGPQESFPSTLLFNIFVTDLCEAINYDKHLLLLMTLWYNCSKQEMLNQESSLCWVTAL
jgi:hypothetical protein